MDPSSTWALHRELRCEAPAVGLAVDASRMGLDAAWLERAAPAGARAIEAMAALERGAIANPDEGRMVGHYWLRAPALAPDGELRAEIEGAARDVAALAERVHSGALRGAGGAPYRNFLCVGIGGSALGPMFVADALGDPRRDRLAPWFLDNTDPDGFDRTLGALGARLAETVVVVTSKSGGTPETRNGMLAAQAAFRAAGIPFASQAVAITQRGSQLDRQAVAEGWLARFPMWDWVGGRTSVTSAVGLVPMALQGLDTGAFLAGAAAMDEATRAPGPRQNPALLLALCWLHATGGKGGTKAMVVLPYKDRLVLFSRYLQQLVMESLGKALDLEGRRVDQGLTVYGNKGSTDQHAYVQQLRDGANDFFATFIRVLRAGPGDLEVEPGVTAGDYLHGFLLGTRRALAESGRASLTITVDSVDARSVGALVALFERAVGFYASLVGVNAYHQPGVEAGKKAAATILALQGRVAAALGPEPRGAEAIAAALGEADVDAVQLLLEHLAANGRAARAGEGFAAATRS
jgi:glucose-6-phosphate isomerase